MENWQYEEDKMLANPPEAPESHFYCSRCNDFFLPDDKVYHFEGEGLCEKCADEWIEENMTYATEEQCYGVQ